TQSAGFGHSNLVVADVDHEQGVRQVVHVLDTADGLVQLFQFAFEHQGFFLAHGFQTAFSHLPFHFFQTLDGSLDRFEVGHHATQPAAVNVRHTATLGLSSHQFASSTLGAYEQHVAATSSQLTHEFGCFFVLNNRFFQVDDVDVVTLTEDERSHLGVPVTGLVAKVHTSFQHFTH